MIASVVEWQTRMPQEHMGLAHVGSSPTRGTMKTRTDILERKSDILKWIEDEEPKAEMQQPCTFTISEIKSFLQIPLICSIKTLRKFQKRQISVFYYVLIVIQKSTIQISQRNLYVTGRNLLLESIRNIRLLISLKEK